MAHREWIENVRKEVLISSNLRRALLGEFVGTAILLLVGNCVVAENVLTGGKVCALIDVNIGFGLAIAFGVAASAKLSGGHINPAVSLMFLSFQKLPVATFFLYFFVQTAGAFVGAALTFLIYYDAINSFDGGTRQTVGPLATAGIFASYPASHLGIPNGFLDQFVGTGVFCFCIAHITDKRNLYPEYAQPILIGISYVMTGLAFAFNCGCPVNPARDLGPRIFTAFAGYTSFSVRNYGWFWVPVIAPLFGAVAGGWIYLLALGIQTPPAEVARPISPVSPSAPPLDMEQPGTPILSHSNDVSPPWEPDRTQYPSAVKSVGTQTDAEDEPTQDEDNEVEIEFP